MMFIEGKDTYMLTYVLKYDKELMRVYYETLLQDLFL